MKRKSGFTLVEIMIVVAIIALLAAVAIPNLLRAKLSANEASARATLKAISTSLENYSVLNNVYPPDTSALLGASPPYLNVNYFSGTHSGYTFAATLADYSYTVTGTPVNVSSGTTSYTVTTGGVLSP